MSIQGISRRDPGHRVLPHSQERYLYSLVMSLPAHDGQNEICWEGDRCTQYVKGGLEVPCPLGRYRGEVLGTVYYQANHAGRYMSLVISLPAHDDQNEVWGR